MDWSKKVGRKQVGRKLGAQPEPPLPNGQENKGAGQSSAAITAAHDYFHLRQ